MKKILNCAALFLITLFSSLFLMVDVQAACDPNSEYDCREAERGDIIATGDTYIMGTSTYTYKNSHSGRIGDYGLLIRQYKGSGDVNDESNYYWLDSYYAYRHYDSYSALYCLDADLGGLNSLYATRFLLDSDSSKAVYAFDLAAMSILVNGAQSADNTTGYMATWIAIRTLADIWGYYKAGSSVIYQAYFGQAYEWINGSAEVKAAYNVIRSKISSALSVEELAKYEKYIFKDKDWQNNPIMSMSEGLFKNAILEAANYLENGGVVGVEEEPTTEIVESKEEENDIGTFVYTDIKHTLYLNNFTNDGKAEFTIEDLKYDKGAETVGATREPTIKSVTIDGVTKTGDLIGKNLLEGFNISNKKIAVEIVLHFEGYKKVNEGYKDTYPTLKCGQQPMDYTLDYSYYDTNLIGKYGNYVGTVWYATLGGGTHQRFIGVEEGKNQSDKMTGKIENEISLTDACSCDDLKEACKDSGNINTDECKEFLDANCGECDVLEVKCEFGDNASCTRMEEVCDNDCLTQFVPIGACCDESDELIISTSDEEKDPYEIHGNKNDEIKACFVTKVDNGIQPADENGNAYKMLTDERVSDNQFCSVNCREDYVMQLPSAKRVNAGRYFTFKTAIQATKQCFTNTIDKDLFEEKMVEAQKAIVDATNNYLYWQAAYNNRTNYQYNTTSYYPDCLRSSYESSVYISVVGVDAWTYPTFQNEFYSFNSQISQETTQSVYEVQGSIGTTYVGEVTCEFWNGKYDENNEKVMMIYKQDIYEVNSSPTMAELEQKLTKRIESSWNAVKSGSQIKAAVDAYAALIVEYNNCALWEANYNYDPTVEYDYEEDYRTMAGMPIEMNETYKKIEDTSYKYCLQQGAGDGPKISDAKYETCTTGFTGHEYFETEAVYTICELETPGGTPTCKQDDKSSRYRVTKARYKKSEQKAESKYKPQSLFYNIYPSGEISVEDGEDRILLEEKLPVALSTRLGIYEYYVDFTNIGEFYKDGTQGRFMGDRGIIEDTTYVCAYLVNIPEQSFVCDDGTIPKCEGPNCVSDCIGPNCNALKCEGENCVADCIGVGCIYNEDSGTSLIEKTVSLNNLFPNGTDSYNWNKSVNEKANTTVEEIESKGNTVYDETPVLSITIDPSSARAIRAYNDSVESDGGYSNSTVSCYSLEGIEEIACYSSFITDLINGSYGNNVVSDNSLIADSNYRTVTDDNTEYFSTWKASIISEQLMIGPSWK